MTLPSDQNPEPSPQPVDGTQLVVGIDVGGTFTDVCSRNELTGELQVFKVPSTQGREADGFLRGLTAASGDLSKVTTIVHGTTVGTNALLERKVARAGLITTAGFRDVLEMRRRDRPRTWGLAGDFKPLIERDLRLEVAERVLADGTLHTEVDTDDVRRLATELLESGAQACCIVFLHSYANPVNEQRALEAIREVWPNEHVSASHLILPEIREFERSSTVALNACLQPVVGGYLADLEAALASRGFDGRFFLVQSSGGVLTVEAARALPVRTALGGPAAGVIACSHLASTAGYDNVIACDMGGTSFDVAVIADGRTMTCAQASIDFGMVIRTPMVEISTIGAGGGSIARLDASGLLRVGPESAGSIPGPACYGTGGEHPTVTDAHLVLGRINGAEPIGGLPPLDTARAGAVIEEQIAEPLGIRVEAASDAIIEVATSSMAGAIRLVSIERGLDPGDFVAMTFGGAGSLHACKLLAATGLRGAVIPRYPGVVSAFGCLVADFRHDLVRTVNLDVAAIDGEHLKAAMQRDSRQVVNFLADAGLTLNESVVSHEFDMAYEGQTHTIVVEAPSFDHLSASTIQSCFDRAYEATYGRVLTGVRTRLLSVRTGVVGKRPRIDARAFAPDATAGTAEPSHKRAVYFNGAWRVTPVYDRLGLGVGASVEGPAILEQPDTTIVIEPNFVGVVDEFGNLIVSRSLVSRGL